jgi:hypothetical protein
MTERIVTNITHNREKEFKIQLLKYSTFFIICMIIHDNPRVNAK